MKYEKLLAELADYQVSCHAEEQARKDYDGYSWDYHGWHYVERRRLAAEAVEKALDEVIEEKVKEALKLQSEVK